MLLASSWAGFTISYAFSWFCKARVDTNILLFAFPRAVMNCQICVLSLNSVFVSSFCMFSLAVCKGLYLLPSGSHTGYQLEVGEVWGWGTCNVGGTHGPAGGYPQVRYHQKLIGCLLNGVCDSSVGRMSLMLSKSNWLLFSKAPHS